jgi:hypothetical protein
MTNPIEEHPQPVDTPVEVRHDEAREVEVDASTYGGGVSSSITLTTHTLGLDPYVLIRAVAVAPDAEDDDGLRLKVESGGDGEGAALAMLYLLNLPAEANPLTAAIKAVIDANPDRHEVAEVLATFAESCDIPMPESGS